MRKLNYRFIVVLAMLLLCITSIFACSVKKTSITLVLNNKEYLAKEGTIVDLDEVSFSEDSACKIEDIKFEILDNSNTLQLDQYSVTYFKLIDNERVLFDAQEIVTNGEYIISIKYNNAVFEFKLKVKISEKEQAPQINIKVNKTSAVWGESTIECTSDVENVEYYIIEQEKYNEALKNDASMLLEKSQKYNKNAVNAGSYYIFACLKDSKYISNLIKIEMQKNNTLKMQYLNEEGFSLEKNITYTEGIFLHDIDFNADNVFVEDEKGNKIEGTYRWKNSNEIVDCGTYGAFIEFVPKDTNYEIISKFVEFNNVIVKQKIPKPTFNVEEKEYTGSELSFEFIDSKFRDLYHIYRDKELVDSSDEVVESDLVDAKNYLYEIVLKDKRNYEWIDDNDEKFEITFTINPKESFVTPTLLNDIAIIDQNASITISNLEGADIHASKYSRMTLKCEVISASSTVSVEEVAIERLENSVDKIVFKNITLPENETSGQLVVKISAFGLNFKNIEKEVTINLVTVS